MSKELPYFKFYTSAWINGDVTLERFELQGLFINICAYYWSKDGIVSMSVLLKKFRGFDNEINELVESNILKINDGHLDISFLNEQMESKQLQKYINQKNGSKGGRPKAEKTEKKPNGLIKETEGKTESKANGNPNLTNIDYSIEDYIKEDKTIEDIDKGVKEKSVSKTKPPPPNLKEVAKTSFENTNCQFGTEFKKNWLQLIGSKKWIKKQQSAVNMSLKKLMEFEESFAIALVENAIAGEYQGVVFPDTEAQYEKYNKLKNGQATSRETAIESRTRMYNLARNVLTGNTS